VAGWSLVGIALGGSGWWTAPNGRWLYLAGGRLAGGQWVPGPGGGSGDWVEASWWGTTGWCLGGGCLDESWKMASGWCLASGWLKMPEAARH
jgi:hypothetical protein